MQGLYNSRPFQQIENFSSLSNKYFEIKESDLTRRGDGWVKTSDFKLDYVVEEKKYYLVDKKEEIES